MSTDMDLGAAYLAILGRPADAPGFAYWKASLDAENFELSTLIKHFTLTREFADRADAFSDDNEAFLNEAYQLILGRDVDSSGAEFYGNMLA